MTASSRQLLPRCHKMSDLLTLIAVGMLERTMADRNDESGHMPISNLSDVQEHVISFISIAPAILSMSASLTIMCLVYKSGFSSSYKRILFGLSVADVNTSITFAVQPFLSPANTSQRFWASGNDATCTLLGAISQLNLATGMYNGILSYYFLFIIRFGVRDSVFARRYEPWMHAMAIVLPIGTAVAGAVMNMYHENEMWLGCWIADYPKGCSVENGECRHVLYGWLFMGALSLFITISIVVINIVIYWHVKRQMDLGSRRSFSGQQQAKRTRDVAVQAFLYVGAYIGTFVWAWALKFVESMGYYDARNEAKLFPLMVLSGLLVPSTGFFNLCIYVRPRYLKTRSHFPHESIPWAIRRALYGESIPPTESSSFHKEPGCFPDPTFERLPNVDNGAHIENSEPVLSRPCGEAELSTSSFRTDS
jgi:hypothetical protein